ncbi:hypothetical protein F8M41_012997 [Gigaspora margarita]|uniref:Uncharacterized protein n=1 Tax=Gigaspora margarita TaxID=4874 RepID=A0A8H4ASP7_GIGMA|nr:hypothetical protein F8M41_012997 [Gigaspora margarita]
MHTNNFEIGALKVKGEIREREKRRFYYRSAAEMDNAAGTYYESYLATNMELSSKRIIIKYPFVVKNQEIWNIHMELSLDYHEIGVNLDTCEMKLKKPLEIMLV